MKLVYFFLGFLFLGLGMLGVFLPLLPTTPFLLVTAFMFAKSSTRFHLWFTSTKIYQQHLATFVQTRSMKKSTMWILLTFTTLILTMSGLLLDNFYVWLVILLLEVTKYIYFIRHVKAI